ncbi:MFS transporter [Amycolatopsis pithecellobii]|uniref:MFS transporter n=1 Tax=Amycolatopsis pithecellobii TaxID=664692 RepID=A0A6N7YLI2_9PSEU|nr:MFS transporter [Amycolatopsis pithecellobii]MTD52882.1 MFS transporter [Amycolatopsis pithecellobii]
MSDKVTKPQFMAWLTAFAGWTFDYYEISLMTFLVVPIAAEFHLSPGQTAFLLSMQLLGIAVGGVIFGYLGDRIGRRRVLMITIALFGIFTLARAFTPGYYTLLAFGVIAAIGLGGEFGVGQSLVSEVMPTGKRGWWGAALYSGAGIGLAGSALVGGYLLPVVGWRWVFAISCFPIALAIIARFAVPESDKWARHTDGSKQGRVAKTDWALVRSPKFLKPLLLCLFACAISFFGFYGVAAFLPTYLIKVQGFSFSKAAWFTVVVGMSISIGSITCGWLADRLGRRLTWSLMASFATVGSVLLGLVFTARITSAWSLVPVFVMYFGTSGAAAFGIVFSEQFPTRVRSLGVGTALQIGRGLSFFPPLIAAAIYPVYGYSPLVFGAAVLFGILAVVGLAFKEGRGRSIDDIEADFAPTPPRTTAITEESRHV